MESYHIEAQGISQALRISVERFLEKKGELNYDKLTSQIEQLAERAYNLGIDRAANIVKNEIGVRALGFNKQTDLLGVINAQKINRNEQRTTA